MELLPHISIDNALAAVELIDSEAAAHIRVRIEAGGSDEHVLLLLARLGFFHGSREESACRFEVAEKACAAVRVNLVLEKIQS